MLWRRKRFDDIDEISCGGAILAVAPWLSRPLVILWSQV